MGRSFTVSVAILTASLAGCAASKSTMSVAEPGASRADDAAFAAYAMSIHELVDRATEPRPVAEADVDAAMLEKTVAALERRRQCHLTNLINTETTAYKSLRAVQNGSTAVTTYLSFDQGPLQNTGRDLDVAITGSGLFCVKTKNGVAYTRSGNFFLNRDGDLVVGMLDGPRVLPVLTFPPNTTEVTISESGWVYAVGAGSIKPMLVGALELSQFINSEALRPIGHGLYAATHESGDATVSMPATDGIGEIRQGFLEGSNVEVIRERVALIKIERQLELIDRLLSRYEQNASVMAQRH